MDSLATGLLRARERALDFIETTKDAPALLLRVTLAGVFISSGYGKINDLEKVTEFFTELAIPMPYFNAVLVSITELVGGSLILVGLCTRLISLPLLCTMVVAILTAQLSEVEGLADFLGLSEFAYAVMFITLAIIGPGRLSLDHLLLTLLGRSPRDSRQLRGSTAELSL